MLGGPVGHISHAFRNTSTALLEFSRCPYKDPMFITPMQCNVSLSYSVRVSACCRLAYVSFIRSFARRSIGRSSSFVSSIASGVSIADELSSQPRQR